MWIRCHTSACDDFGDQDGIFSIDDANRTGALVEGLYDERKLGENTSLATASHPFEASVTSMNQHAGTPPGPVPPGLLLFLEPTSCAGEPFSQGSASNSAVEGLFYKPVR